MKETLFKALMQAREDAIKLSREEPNLYEKYKYLGQAEGLLIAIDILNNKEEE